MKNQKVFQTFIMLPSEMKENYVAPKTVFFNVQTEGLLCSSVHTIGSADNPEYGGSAGFNASGTANSIWD